MKNLNLKNLTLGAMIPVVVMLFIGAANVLERYHTIKAKEFQIINDEGTVVLDFSTLAMRLDLLESGAAKEESINYDGDIEALKGEINDFKSKFKAIELMMSAIDDLNTKMNQSIADLDTKLESYQFKAPTSEKCGPNCTKQCCINKQQSIEVREGVVQDSPVGTNGEIAMLSSSLNTYINSSSMRLDQIESDISRMSSNQDMIMKILRRDLKKLNK
jgi:hypothetical protein